MRNGLYIVYERCMHKIVISSSRLCVKFFITVSIIVCFILNKTCDCIVAIGVNVCHHDVFPPCTGGELGKELVNHSYVLSLYSSLSTASSLFISPPPLVFQYPFMQSSHLSWGLPLPRPPLSYFLIHLQTSLLTL